MLTDQTIVFLGGGNMASAIINGLLKAGISPSCLRVAEPNADARIALQERFTVATYAANSEAVLGAHLVVVAVKPAVVATVLAEVAGNLAADTLVVSIAAGVAVAELQKHLPGGQPVMRVMPNTPALIGAGISVLCPAPGLADAHVAKAKALLDAVGEAVVVRDEHLMDGVTALSGSGPAYVYLLAEAMADGGVVCGLPRPLALKLAVQTLIGAARLIAETGEHPGLLKDRVTSPGGTTIAGILELEKAGVRGAVMEAVIAAWKRSRELA